MDVVDVADAGDLLQLRLQPVDLQPQGDAPQWHVHALADEAEGGAHDDQ